METFPYYVEDFNTDALGIVEGYQLVQDHDPFAVLPEILAETNNPEIHGLLQAGNPDMSEDEEPPSEEWIQSSEGDYFYTDGQGNVYPIEREGTMEDDNVGWPSTPQLSSSEFSHEGEVVDEARDGDANESYIMYHEVQHWSPAPGIGIHPVDVAGPFPALSPLDGAPFGDGGG